ncbi:excinuclease ABC subunit UvrA [Ornithobacterium rhinotracheale]|uniref:excinuclease ABC subunit UvrA n=1 Tax=Ornithobacterium rhinotracheale TaxID=28251 RepID=UPI00129C2E09|nr:excinuclease ABC subunit UvrA [Ornithobacterium rhinotracheale]MRJ11041.1 excinuclease ABC subunit UvrA [Ornithobacterium rhinotracheale]
MENDSIQIYGAREHNLKNLNLEIPRDQLVVFTGLSGSGKSSLAFDTIYAEGQRRYIETFSAYARQLLGGMERPDVDKIDGLSPVVAIEQKTTSKSPRSTVGTITEVYDFLRLLFARASTAYSYVTGEKMVSYTDDEIKELLREKYDNKKIAILAPVVRTRKGHYRELFEQIGKRGFVQVRVDGEIRDIEPGMKLDRYKNHDIEIVVDKLLLNDETNNERLQLSLETAMSQGENVMMVYDYDKNEVKYFSREMMCPTSGISYPKPEPNTFSFNSPKGACPTCNGLGTVKTIQPNSVIPDPSLSLAKGAIAPMEDIKHKKYFNQQIAYILAKFEEDDKTPFQDLSEETKDAILYGRVEEVEIELKASKVKKKFSIDFEGVIPYLERIINDKENTKSSGLEKRYAEATPCPTCEGTRLKKESLYFKIDEKNIAEVSAMDLENLHEWIQSLPKKLGKSEKEIAKEILKEIETRIAFLLDVGLNYLSLNRSSKSLSGGEAQRIRLATQIGTQLVNVLYILDEPSIGLHPRDNQKLIHSLENLRDIGNSVIVVEHDEEMIMASDYVVDIGPYAGKRGGRIVWQGKPSELKKAKTLTADYINQIKKIEIPKEPRKGSGDFLELKGASGNNLKNVDIKIPLSTLTVVTGVSGSGKSTLINETLYRILNQKIYHAIQKPMPYKEINGLEHVDKVIDIDQSPIGRTPRSNPATYTGVFSDIRALFSNLPEAKIRGYKPGRFSFNVKGGRCETCQGAGLRQIEMNFLPDIYVPCETCHGKRFNRETLEVRYKGKSISDVLDMTIDEAVEFFQPIPKIYQKVKMLQEVGLGYITLGQQSTTLSGGEAQRIKLATELSKKQTGKTVYILDEPTTGLHFEDIRVLMNVIQRLVDLGNTIIIIEHNIDVIRMADYIIDIGPEGGVKGGTVVAQGAPNEIKKSKKSITAQFI